MPRSSLNPAAVETTLRRLRARAQNVLSLLPGDRPAWVVVDVGGLLVARASRPRFFGVPVPPHLVPERGSLEELAETLESLSRARWLEGVLFRFENVRTDLATAYSLRRAIDGVRRAGKSTTAYMQRIDWSDYYLASAADQVVVPESADISLHGIGLTVTFLRDALARHGVRFEKIAVGEYKNALDPLVRQEMSPAHREQLDALLARIEEHHLAEIAKSRRMTPEQVRAAIDEGLTSAEQAKKLGLVDRVAYEDELLDKRHKPLHQAKRFLRLDAPAKASRRVAVVSLTGAIMPGKSRHPPLPLPPFGTQIAGSDTVVRALRAADQDPGTAAIVLYVDSGGGSAMASDLIWREVARVRERKPVVAVMGSIAASGGYYVLTHAHRVIAAPTTITGSIGVFTGKLQLEGFYEKYGLNAEQIRRGRYALLQHPARPLSDDDRALLQRSNDEIYQRFLARVAEGRKLGVERVHEIARGRVWAGTAAREIGLVDELGDLETGIERARELAGLGRDAPVWNVSAPKEPILPTSEDPTTLRRQMELFSRESSLLICPMTFQVG